jgi:hypothetical protein
MVTRGRQRIQPQTRSHASRGQANPAVHDRDLTSSGALNHGSDDERAWAGEGKQSPSEATTHHSKLRLGKEQLWLEASSTDPVVGRPDLAMMTGDGTGGEGADA